MAEIVMLQGQRHVLWQCGECGVLATCPEIVYNQHHAEGGYHHCPNGHSWGWTKETCEREKLRQERDRLKQRQAMLEDEKREALERASKAEAATVRLKKRATAGVCPCCNRTFLALSRHMKSKHPNIVALEQKRA